MKEEIDAVRTENREEGKTIRDILRVAISNLFTILSGVLVGFLIPKMMGQSDYGYYKIFTLYLGYVGLFHFGFCDGIYLLFGGKRYDELDKRKFRCYSRFLLFFQCAISFVITAIALCFVRYDYGFIFLFISLSLLSSNIITYYQFISQITGRFRELSLVNLVKSFLTVVAIAVLYGLYYAGVLSFLKYQIYVVITSFILVLIALWYVFAYREITFGEAESFKNEKKMLSRFFIVGIPLMLSNFVSNMILQLDRQFVSLLYDTADYAVYAFAYNMLGLVTVAISAIATVLYPTLKRYDENRLKTHYSPLISLLSVITGFCLIVYFPLILFVRSFLPAYTDSLLIFRIILPGIMVSTNVSVVIFNYYNALGKSNRFFFISIGILVLSVVANFIAWFVFRNYYAISSASVIVLFIWYAIADFCLIRRTGIRFSWKNYAYPLILMSGFYLATAIENVGISFGVYFILYLVMTPVFFGPLIVRFIRKLKSR